MVQISKMFNWPLKKQDKKFLKSHLWIKLSSHQELLYRSWLKSNYRLKGKRAQGMIKLALVKLWLWLPLVLPKDLDTTLSWMWMIKEMGCKEHLMYHQKDFLTSKEIQRRFCRKETQSISTEISLRNPQLVHSFKPCLSRLQTKVFKGSRSCKSDNTLIMRSLNR